jgi:hypothetical protein
MLWLIAYILGIIFMLPRQLRIESRQREYDKHEENYNVYRESAVALANEFYLEERKERTLSMSDGETSINASGDTSTHSTDASPWAQWGGVYYTHGPDSGKSALSAISGLSALSAPSQYEGETVAPAVPVPVQPSTSDMPSGATLSPPTQAATLHSPNPGLMYGGSSTTFASETARSPTLNDGSSPSTKFTPTFSVEPPLPSPREQEDLGGQVVGSSPPRVNLNLDVGWRLSVQPPKRTPSPRLPWAGQVKKQEFV